MTGYTSIWLEDFEVGQHAIYGDHHFTRDAVIDFARKYDPQAFHLDDDAAARTYFGRLSASGWHTGSACMKLVASYHFSLRDAAAARGEPLPSLGPSPGFENLQWIKPVYPGDTVTYGGTITGARKMKSRPDWGLVTLTPYGRNQYGEKVFSYDSTVMFACRGNIGT